MSALCNAAGMFTPSGHQIWNNTFNWQPVPIHTIPTDDDYLVFQGIPCDIVDETVEKLKNSEAMTTYLTRYDKIVNYIEENTGIKLETNQNKINTIYSLYSSLSTERDRGLPLVSMLYNI